MTKELTKKDKKSGTAEPQAQSAFRTDPVLCFLKAKSAPVRMWGMSPRERLVTQFANEGITEIIALDDLATHNGPVILLREDCVIDPPLVPVIAKRPEFALLSDVASDSSAMSVHTRSEAALEAAEAMQAGEDLPATLNLIARRPSELSATFWGKLRKREVPYARAVSPDTREETEWRMFMGTYKGATDLVTKYLWPRPAFYVTRALAPTSVTPNLVTALSAVCVVLAFWLFWEGQFLAGLVAAWMMTFLDTVDGKLARTTLTSSKWGDVFDHGIDLIHPPFWWWSWAVGAGMGASASSGAEPLLAPALATIVAGYIAQRLEEGWFIARFGADMHTWRRFDSVFREVTARRNPNLLILTASTALGLPAEGLVVVAAWVAICFAVHFCRIVQAHLAARHGPLVSWMAEP
ncbi:MAG: CDP-alcohol phosphatidyltransferase family protein [Pseudomonadota bacterium]